MTVSLANVDVRYGANTALSNVSLSLGKGDFAALVGGNGSGKTTLLRCILGFTRHVTGRLSVFGEGVDRRSARSLRRRIGYVPQCPEVDVRMPMSVRDVVAIGRCAHVRPGRRLGKDDRNAIERALDSLRIGELADRPFGHLSGGERQKALIARALCQEPELMLLDEPTSNLDFGAECECLDLLARIHAERKLTMLLVMHDLEALPKSCSRALILNAGRLVVDGPFNELLREENLRHVYGANAARVIQELQRNGCSNIVPDSDSLHGGAPDSPDSRREGATDRSTFGSRF